MRRRKHGVGAIQRNFMTQVNSKDASTVSKKTTNAAMTGKQRKQSYTTELTEHQIQNQIASFLRYEGYYVIRQNVGALETINKYGRKQLVKFGKSGMSDLFAIKNGKIAFLEVKRLKTRNRATSAQLEFIELMRHYGCIAGIVCSIEETASLLGIKLIF